MPTANTETVKESAVVAMYNELTIIKDMNGGLLDPAHVVDHARDPKSALHSRFEWNNGKAAEQYRIWQARQIISSFKVIPYELKGSLSLKLQTKESGDEPTVRAFVSLSQDRAQRKEDNEIPAGYRSIQEVITDEDLSQMLLDEAKKEMQTFKHKYSILKELRKVMAAIDEVLES